MPENAMMMIHDPSGLVIGTGEDMEKMADVLAKIKSNMVRIYQAKTGLPDAEIEDLMAAETWFTAQEAVDKGFADEIHVHRPGALFPERTELWIYPRISSFARAQGVRPRRGEEHDQVVLIVSCHVKNPPGGREDLEELSKLTDVARAVVDATERAGAAKILDETNTTIAIVDFGAANESRSYQESVTVGGISIPGVDSTVLTVVCEISRTTPRPRQIGRSPT